MYSRILVPIDGSDYAANGLEIACLLAGHYKSKLILLSVTETDIPDDIVAAAINEGIVRPESYDTFVRTLDYPGMTAARAEATRGAVLSRVAGAIAGEIVERGAHFASEQDIPEVLTLVRSGDPDDCIVDTAKDYDADLIVVGSRGKEGLDALFHPSVADSVRKKATCPTMVLFPGDSD